MEKEIKLIIPESKVEGVNVSGDLLQRNFCYMVIGPPGSGKSTLIVNMLKHPDLYFQKFNKVIFVTPTGFETVTLIEDDNWYKNINPIWLKTKLEDISKANKTPQNILVIFDDVIGQFHKYENDPFMIDLFYNRRHPFPNVCVSIIIGSQKYNLFPFKFRTTITGLWIFKVTKNIWNEIEKELLISNTKGLTTSLPMLFRKKYDCIYINNNNELVFHNFKKIFI
jgi:hypothetical protein